MPIPGGVISGHWMSWVFYAPLLPLLLLVVKKTEFSAMITCLALLCVSTLLTNTFVFLAPGNNLPPSFAYVHFGAEFLFSGLLLKTCTPHTYLKYGIATAILVFLGVYITYSLFNPPENGIRAVMTAGIILLFMLSLLVLASRLHILDKHLIEHAGFWFAAGIFFYFGIMSLLVFAQQGRNLDGSNEQGQVSSFYSIIFFLEYMFFSAGILLQKPLDSNANSLQRPMANRR